MVEATRRLEAIRRAETRIRLDADPSAFTDTKDSIALVNGLLTDAGKATLSEERRRTYKEVQDILQTHGEAFDRVSQFTRTFTERRAGLFSGGD